MSRPKEPIQQSIPDGLTPPNHPQQELSAIDPAEIMQKITNKPSLIWELGTDCLPESDLKLLDDSNLVSFTKPEASILNVDVWRDIIGQNNPFSATLSAIMDQAKVNGYQYVMFDCDLETSVELT